VTKSLRCMTQILGAGWKAAQTVRLPAGKPG
jgi:hypothetical protein